MRRNTTWLPGATSGNPLRPTATQRPWVVAILDDSHEGFPTTHPYVRNFWLPLVGPGAVADLLRLAAAAQRGRPLKRPENLPILIREGLVRPLDRGTVVVRDHVPGLAPVQVRRLHPALRREHQRFAASAMKAVA